MKIAVLGPYPPPTHGLSVATNRMANFFDSRGATLRINRAPPAVGKKAIFAQTLNRLAATAHAVKKFYLYCKEVPRPILYVALSGGKGQIVDLLFILMVRTFSGCLIIHHHSYSYLTNPTLLARLVFGQCRDAIHISLCPPMKDRLHEIYHIRRDLIVVCSNAALMKAVPAADLKPGQIAFGFISNITEEKGIFEFLSLAADVRKKDESVHWRVAGPVEERIRERFLHELRKVPSIEYVGPVYGSEKDAYLASLDVLVFPTRYKHEAEPISVLEAMNCGVVVVAYRRGCLECMVAEGSRICDSYGELVSQSIELLTVIRSNRRELAEASIAHVQQLRREGMAALENMLERLEF